MTAPARRVLVRDMTAQGVSERRALALVRMSASSLRYTPAPDTNAALRARIVALAHQHRRYGAGMISLKLRQAGALVNHKRVERLYTEARLQVRRRRRKKIPVADRQPLIRPQAPNEVWSADFVFDRTADGRVVKCLTVVDDATTEAVAAFAKLCGACPIPAASGRTTGRHRLYRGGHRQANAALYRAVIVRMRFHQPTIDYVARRSADGRTQREIIRCLKRFLARERYQRVMTDFRMRQHGTEAA